MKKYIFYAAASTLIVLLFAQCKKPKELDNAVESVLPGLAALIRSDSEPVNGTVLLWYQEYMDDDRDGNSGSYSASFFAPTGERTYAGTMTVGEEQTNVPFLSNGNQQYQLYINKTQVYGTTVGISVSGSTTFPAVNTGVYVPKKMKATSSMAAFELSKSNNLSIDWEPDANNTGSKVFILIVADNPGSSANPPAIIIETEDDGQYIVNSSTFQNFQVGGTASIHIGRGKSFVTNQGGKEIEITSVVEARSGPVDVIQ